MRLRQRNGGDPSYLLRLARASGPNPLPTRRHAIGANAHAAHPKALLARVARRRQTHGGTLSHRIPTSCVQDPRPVTHRGRGMCRSHRGHATETEHARRSGYRSALSHRTPTSCARVPRSELPSTTIICATIASMCRRRITSVEVGSTRASSVGGAVARRTRCEAPGVGVVVGHVRERPRAQRRTGVRVQDLKRLRGESFLILSYTDWRWSYVASVKTLREKTYSYAGPFHAPCTGLQQHTVCLLHTPASFTIVTFIPRPKQYAE